ncbi:MAG: hypothetical protein OHK93_006358 [Ramalina farinacea]|uniref:Uncharacterized protein n=1 Tax=Ramalina farinacea TaxID=258253 RepID=A0AA43QIE7_9LECA|nr:hypothetical protein [Ramalina farinacea]
MYSPSILSLLVNIVLVAGRATYSDYLEPAHPYHHEPCLENEGHAQSLLAANSFQQPENGITVLAEPVEDKNELTERAKKLLTRYPQSMNVTQSFTNVTGILNSREYLGWGEIKLVNVEFPLLSTCRPKLSPVKAYGRGLICGKNEISCLRETELSNYGTYSAELGFKVGMSFAAETNAGLIKASVTSTFEASWTTTSTTGHSQTDKYSFTLKPDTSCQPSLVSLELECDVGQDTVFFDTLWRESGNQITLEGRNHRGNGPYADKQWCRSVHLSEEIVNQEQYFTTVLQSDESRGKVWTRPSSDLNRYKTNKEEPDIEDTQMVIRRGSKDTGDLTEVWVCDPYRASGKKRTMTFPFGDGSMGYVACV